MDPTEHPIRNPYLASPAVESEADLERSLRDVVRVGQIVTFALVQGVVLLTAVAIYLIRTGEAEAGGAVVTGDWFLPLFGLGVALVAIVASWTVSGQLLRGGLARFAESGGSDSTPLLNTHRTATIVALAILEGAAMLNAVLMIVDRNWFHLPAIAVLILAMIVRVPTVARLKAFVQLSRESVMVR